MKYFFILCLLITLNLHADTLNQERFEKGQKMFNDRCISCHLKTGETNTDINLYTHARDLKKSILREEQTFAIIKFGAKYAGADMYEMPSFRIIFSDEEIRDISYFLSKNFNPNIQEKIDTLYAQSDAVSEVKKAKMLKRGKKIYNRACMWCHGIDGKGNGQVASMPAFSIFPTDLTRTLMDTKQHFLYTKYGGAHWGGYKEDMPKWSPKYDDYTIKSVVRYVEEVLKKQ